MKNKSRRRRGEFLEHYRVDDAYLLKPDRKRGRPGILSGVDENGSPVLIKFWPKVAKENDAELREIWHHEVRQLHRLGGYPGASDTIVTLQQAGVDETGFYLVLDPGQRRPLDTILTRHPHGHWLLNQRSPSNRAKLWRNLLRVCRGLETLHTQGLLHKNIDHWAILSAGVDEPDFQLTGFEWSIRLVGAAAGRPSSRRPSRPDGEPSSFLHDWRDLGLLIADLMHISMGRLVDMKLSLSSVSEHMTVEEVRLLRDLIQAVPIDRLDGEIIERRISEILRTLEAEIATLDAKHYLAFRLGRNSKLSQQIREASDNEVEVDSTEEQLDYIKDDLSDSPLLIAIKLHQNESFRLVLQGKNLLYSLDAYLHQPTDAIPTWELAYCDHAELRGPASINVLGNVELQPSSLGVIDFIDARKRFGRMRGKIQSWQTLRREFELQKAPLDRGRKLHQALALTQFLEALYAAADAFPVEVLESDGEVQEDMYTLKVKSRSDTERETLSEAIGMKAPAFRFDDVLTNDRRSGDWVLTEARHVGTQEPTDTIWRFEEKRKSAKGPPTYLFSGANPPPQLKDPVLISGDFVGRDIQLQRHLKALRALADHEELLWMLVDPRRRILDSHESISQGSSFADLDESKQKAMTAIIETLPLFLVQGPPGVGKTRMVRELVNDIFHNDATARLLLSAQSNAAVDHLMDTLHPSFEADQEDILIVRCRPRDNNEEPSPYEIQMQASDIIKRFSKSSLVNSAPKHLKNSVIALASDLASSGAEDKGNSINTFARYARQAIEGLVVRAANVVFATTNSYELERLIDERGQFDWSIVEEAGKATGGELIAPLLLSYRRLMIGDHKQLSPFGSERIVRLLENPQAVKTALETGQEFVSRDLRDPSTDEVLDQIDDDSMSQDDFAALCSLAIDCLLLFERMIEDEFAQQVRKPKARTLAHRLDQQHRMHPAIARLVSRAFYDEGLDTHPSAVQRFGDAPCPVTTMDSKRLPSAPIIMVDMPYVQSTVKMDEAERYPRWHNPDELGAVLEILQLLSPSQNVSKPPSLAILSPYSEQVRRLQKRIDEDLSSFPNVQSFLPAVSSSSYCGTVDSFQGNEADVVVVSLVRNNHHSGVRSALGFLSDARRMNVLLSRAKWRMILVCSSEFLRTVIATSQDTDAAAEISFLSKILDGIERERSNGNSVVISYDRLMGKGKK